MARVVIVGAGIGGLCAARAVEMAGHEPVVLERMTGATSVGAGLLLWPNAVQALDALGHGEAVRRVAGQPHRMTIRNRSGRVLAQTDLVRLVSSARAPMLVIERPELHQRLSAGIHVRQGVEVRAVDDRGVTLAGGERVDADVVIGADGIGSTVREYVCPGLRPSDTGYTVLRGLSDYELGEAFEVWGRGELVGGVNLGNGRSYWFLEAPNDRIDQRNPVSGLATESWPHPVPALIQSTPPDAILVNRILRLPPVPAWARKNVALLGDAAHAMEPNLGQGAAQAIEDALGLQRALRDSPDPERALADYVGARRRRARIVQRQSARVARLALSTHTTARDLLTRLTPDSVRIRMLEQLMRAAL